MNNHADINITSISCIDNNSHQNLILIHGWAFDSNIWRLNIEELKTKYNIYTIDLNGHGNSSFNSEYNNLDVYLQQISKLLPNNNNNITTILGWSLGGIIALNLKHKYPDLIKNIILCCSNPCFIANNNWQYGVEENIWAEFNNKLLNNSDKTIKDFLLLQTLNHHNTKTLYKNLLNITKNSPAPSIEGLQWGLNILQQDYREILNNINLTDKQSIKVILGAKDSLVNKNLISWLQQTYPEIQTYLLHKSGHMPFITEPELFYQCL